jgi:hypothetical protein
METANIWITRVSGTGVSIVAGLWNLIANTKHRVTVVLGAQIPIVAYWVCRLKALSTVGLWLMRAQASYRITGIKGAAIEVVTEVFLDRA